MSEALNNHVNRLIEEITINVYNPTFFRQHLARNGGDAQKTITEMLTPPTPVQEGFIKLSMANRLDLSIEALVLYSDFTNEFSDEVKQEARRRLRGSGVTTAWGGTGMNLEKSDEYFDEVFSNNEKTLREIKDKEEGYDNWKNANLEKLKQMILDALSRLSPTGTKSLEDEIKDIANACNVPEDFIRDLIKDIISMLDNDANMFGYILDDTLNNHVNRLIEEITINVYNPTFFRQHLARNGGDAQKTITEMLTPPTPMQEGFIKLSMANRLDLSIEALVLYSDFTNEFSDEVKQEARRCLRGSGVTTAWKY